MIRENKIKKGLKEGKNYIGTFAKITDASVVEILGIVGFDFFVVDNEHTLMNRENLANIIRAADISGIVPIIRVVENNSGLILQAFDAGALGVMIPSTGTKKAVQDAVTSTYYLPEGNRGYAPTTRAAAFGLMDFSKYAALANQNNMLICYCETKEAVENLDEMLSVKGLDLIFIGPMDLSNAYGVSGQGNHPIVLDVIDKIIKKAVAAGVPVGITAGNAEQAKSLIDRGCQFIILGSDQGFIGNAGRQYMKELGRG